MIKYLARKFAPTVKDPAPFLQSWPRVRQKGMLRYVLTAGVLGFGIPWLFLMFAGKVFFDTVIHAQTFAQSFATRLDEFGSFAVIWVCSAILSGVLFGLWMWYYNSSLYNRLLERIPPSASQPE